MNWTNNFRAMSDRMGQMLRDLAAWTGMHHAHSGQTAGRSPMVAIIHAAVCRRYLSKSSDWNTMSWSRNHRTGMFTTSGRQGGTVDWLAPAVRKR